MRLLTWNIQCGRDSGEGFTNGWPRRKLALRNTLQAEHFDVLCVQEALPGQLEFLSHALPAFSCVSFARECSAGEHCAILFDPTHFECLESSRFWLSDTPDRPGPCWDIHFRRICMWAQMRERSGGETFRLFNTHFPLLPSGREKSARLVLTRMPPFGTEPALLCGDFNCGPPSAAWRLFERNGLLNTGRNPATKTFRRLGISLCLDAVFATRGWTVREHRVVGTSAKKSCPSDHRGIMVELQRGSVAPQTVGGISHATSDSDSLRDALEPVARGHSH